MPYQFWEERAMLFPQRQLRCFLTVLILGAGVLVASNAALAAACKTDGGQDGHLITFINKSNEDVVIGVLGSVFDANDDRVVDDAGYASAANWVLQKTMESKITWCAPQKFNGRFFVRTGCKDGKCSTGDCCKGDSCPGNVCDTTAQPTSLAEVFFDSKSGTWYDVSFVDGYDFPLLMQPTNPTSVEDNCEQAGCSAVPTCPWNLLVNGVCLAPHKQFEFDYYDSAYQPDYYVLAAMCAQREPPVCGCGNQCTTGSKTFTSCPTTVTTTNPYTNTSVVLHSSGCSPINTNYGTDTLATNQITCDPASDATTTSYGTTCNPWPARYKNYVTAINKSCGGEGKTKGVYTWQYSDKKGLFRCNKNDALGFEMTILPRDTTTAQAHPVTFNPGGASKDGKTPRVTGSIERQTTENNVPKTLTYKLQGPESLKLPMKVGDLLTIKLDCATPDFTMTCSLKYSGDASGFTVDAAKSAVVCSDTKNFKDWGKTAIGLPYPDNTWCASSTAFRLQISPADGVKGHVCIGADTTPKSFSPKASPPITVRLADKDLFRLVQDCGVDKNAKARIIDCSADFSLTGGFTPKKIVGASKVCTDNRINWKQVFENKNLGLGAFVPDVDCVQKSYTEACPVGYVLQDARSGLQLHHGLPTEHSDPLKLDPNRDGKVDLIDVIMMLRSSMGL
jgi:hypothetical protein